MKVTNLSRDSTQRPRTIAHTERRTTMEPRIRVLPDGAQITIGYADRGPATWDVAVLRPGGAYWDHIADITREGEIAINTAAPVTVTAEMKAIAVEMFRTDQAHTTSSAPEDRATSDASPF